MMTESLKLRDYADACFVEGYAVLIIGLVIDRGWVRPPDGTIIAPTLPRECLVEFAGLEFRGEPAS